MDTMCIYLRLFLGMGIIWYFEILAFALTSYNLNPNIFILTDTLNMCQVRKRSKCKGRCFSLVLHWSSFMKYIMEQQLWLAESPFSF